VRLRQGDHGGLSSGLFARHRGTQAMANAHAMWKLHLGSHVTGAQMRAARGLVNWSVRELSEKSGVRRNTISNIETGWSLGDSQILARLVKALSEASVEFIGDNAGGPGVRLRKR
jgi:hypothetical protein